MTDHIPESPAELGWDPFFDNNFRKYSIPGGVPCRVTSQFRDSCRIHTGHHEFPAVISGRMRYSSTDFPATGDWVIAVLYPETGQAVIHAVLPRKSAFSRKAAGPKAEEQIVAANVDTVFIVTALDGNNFNPRRLERYLTMAWKSGASPVFVMNKADLCPDTDSFIRQTEETAMGVPVYAVSAIEKTGLDCLKQHIGFGQTAAFMGSSGVGKSALINAILGNERQLTRETSRFEHKGRHTTTYRELILLPGSGMVIDTPGMKEIGMWGDESALTGAFEDIEALARECRFNDCTHENEPGCAVRDAIENGKLAPERYRSYLKLLKELRFNGEREDKSLRQIEQLRWKKIARSANTIIKNKYK